MAPSISTFSSVFLVLLALYLNLILHQVTSTLVTSPPSCAPITAADVDRLQFAMNLEYCQAEYFLQGALLAEASTATLRVCPEVVHLPSVLRRLCFSTMLLLASVRRLLINKLGAYAMPDLAQVSYVSSIPSLTTNSSSLSLAAKLLAIKAGQSAVLRALLYPKATQLVPPYNFTVREFTEAISQLTNDLGKCGIKRRHLAS